MSGLGEWESETAGHIQRVHIAPAKRANIIDAIDSYSSAASSTEPVVRSKLDAAPPQPKRKTTTQRHLALCSILKMKDSIRIS